MDECEFNTALGLVSELVVINPKRLPWQQLKLRANSRMADAANLYGAKEEADATYRNSLVIQREVATLMSTVGSKHERRLLAESVDTHGDVLSALSDYSAALVAYRLALAIRDDSLRAYPDEGKGQRRRERGHALVAARQVHSAEATRGR